METLKFIKLSDNEFTINGNMNICEHFTKSVEIDGETYFRNTMKEVSKDVTTLNKHYWFEHILEFPFINSSYKLHDYQGFVYGTLIDKYCKYGVSSNPTVSAYQLLFYEKVLDKRILDIYTSNTSEVSLYWFKRHFDINRIPILLHSYGFNNSVYCSMKLIDFLSIENKQLLFGYEHYKNYFMQTYDVNIDEEINFKMADKLIRKLIRDKQKQLN